MSPDNTLTGKLDEIRAMQGKDPLPDPHKIQGFGPEDPPPPRLLETDPDVPREWLDPEVDFEQPKPKVGPKPSPLIPAPKPAATVPQPGAADVERILGMVELLSWNGIPAPFSDDDKKSIRAITVRAFQRALAVESGYWRVSTKRPRKPVAAPSVPNGTEAQPQPPKRRGRPRGSLLRTQP